ncbi:MAG: ribosomal-processing cysteine protease Prp [Clostridia bacterium]|nr:ribosomal-processing cysteine protease Prp [Clostridia bacterium]
MITVYADRRGAKYRLLVQGHAGEGSEAPLVCAAVSALTGALLSFAEQEPRCRNKRLVMREGEVFLSCVGGLRGAFDMTVQALAALAAAYPLYFHALHRTALVDGTVRWYSGEREKASAVSAHHER